MEVLDIGSGPNPKGTVNVDVSPKYRPTVIADARHLPFKASVFDGAYLSHILEHVIDPEKILKETHRVMKTGKLATIIFPNFGSLGVLMAWILGFYAGSSKDLGGYPYIISPRLRMSYNIVYGSHTIGEYDVHHVPLSLPILSGLLRELGFKVNSIKGDFVRLPLMRFRGIRVISKALAKAFPSRANIITITAKKFDRK